MSSVLARLILYMVADKWSLILCPDELLQLWYST